MSKMPSLSAITAEELQAHIARFLSQLDIKALVVGNMYKDVSSIFPMKEWTVYLTI